jgi:hypothetical protein
MERKRELFLSHSAADIDLAEYLDLSLRSAVPGIEVFRTTRPGKIPTGRDWFNVIAQHLRSADCFLVLLTEASMTRPWISFETGAAWFSERQLVPVLAPGLQASRVPEPLRLLQLASLDDPAAAAQLFAEIGGQLENPEEFVARAKELAAHGRQKGLSERFQGIVCDGAFYAYEGPFEELATGDPVPMLDGLPVAFRDAGFDVVMVISSRPETALAAGYKKVWLLDQWNQRRPLLSKKDAQQLYVKPTATRG